MFLDEEVRRHFKMLLKVGIPYTILGMIVIFGGIYLIKIIMGNSEYLTVTLFLWLAVFWFVYQPLFRRRMKRLAEEIKEKKIKGG